jgi:hypothetical protein
MKTRIMALALVALFGVALIAPAAHARNVGDSPSELRSRSSTACSIIDGTAREYSRSKVTCD